ncbi:odorant receptor 10-like isoform X1 [Linepithema humile]|uniref:odorant receptor 10-like isoform X1 n=1 Tax=Linepithema humile TaxID=83485 RepID=UPI00351F4EF8
MWNDDIAYAMAFSKFFTLPLGGWPLQEFNTFTLIRFIMSFCITFSLIITSFINAYYMQINIHCGNMYGKIDALMIGFCCIPAVVKHSMFRIYAENMTRNYSSAISDYCAIDTKEKRTVMRQHAFLGRMIFYFVVAVAFTTSVGLIMTPVIEYSNNGQVNASTNKPIAKYPVPSDCTWGQLDVSTGMYLLLFVVQCIQITIGSSAYVGNDSLFLTITLHVCGQMELLGIEFRKFAVETKNIKMDLLKLTTRHCYLLSHAQQLADAISVILLTQLFCSSILICIIGFQFILALKVVDVVMIIKASIALITFLSQLFAYSVVGEYLKSQTEEIAYSIYCSNWHCLSSKFMKNILFIIVRSQQPVTFMAGRYLVVNLQTYMSILETSFQYLSILRMMVET